MKISEITEATNVNVTIINEIIDQIFNMLPNEIDISTYTKADSINGKFLNLTNLRKRFPKFEEFFDHIQETKFLFINGPQYENIRTMGLYDPEQNVVVVNLSITMYYFKTHTKEEIIKKSSRANSPYAVLFHEIRHVMQHKDYPDHFSSEKARQKQYMERDIEIDAAWYNIIAIYDPKKFKPKAYAKRVMDDLDSHRKLNQQQKNHYYKKTLKYYANPNALNEPKLTNDERIKQMVAKKILTNVKTSDFDLRKLKNYNSGKFLFPTSHVIDAVRSALVFIDAETNFTKNMIYFISSLYVPKTFAKMIVQFMKKFYNYSLEDAINNFEIGMPPNHFDHEAMKNHMKEFYS
jgi:hypothetical protein